MRNARRTCILLECILLACLLLTGCQQRAYVETPLGTFAVEGHKTLSTYSYARPPDGQALFAIFLGGDDNVEWDQRKLYTYFCAEQPVRVAPDDGMPIAADGISMELVEKSGKYRCVVLFKVPESKTRTWTVFWPNGTQTEMKG